MNTSHNISVNNVDIIFPYEPYQVQVQFMSKLLDCLKGHQNGLLESPTGTGKTLSLLCGSLAWLQTHKAYQQASLLGLGSNSASQKLFSTLSNSAGADLGAPSFASTKIIYSSRTHSQLSQVVQELKRTAYNTRPSVVLGSRDQLCLLPEVANLQNNSAKLHACRAKVKNHSCPYYLNVENKLVMEPDYRKNAVLDIEDLVILGKKHTCCPYYAARELKNKSEMIFTPYNYLIDPKTRKAHGINIQNSVIIFDEAHNIESICEDSLSFQLRSRDLAFAINEVTQIIQAMGDNQMNSDSSPGDFDFSIEDLSSIKVMLSSVESELDKAVLDAGEKGVVKEGKYMFELLGKAELNEHNKDRIQHIFEQIMVHLSGQQNMGSVRGIGLGKICDMLMVLYANPGAPDSTVPRNQALTEFNRRYKVFIQEERNVNQKNPHDFWTVGPKKSGSKSWTLNCWCFSAEMSMKDLMSNEVHSLILTSGTLSPLHSFAEELGIPFPVQLENPHIIDDHQVFVAIVDKGPDKCELTSSYCNRGNARYLNSLGQAINNFCQVIPKGVLAVFPSYTVMEKCIDSWHIGNVWKSLNAKKEVFTEPRGKDAFIDCMDKYSQAINNSRGALLFGVCRGKVSEGLDFSDENARGVIVTGVPFAPLFDMRVQLKKKYLNENGTKRLNGDNWYMLQAIRAVNQAIGRVIRHRHDFGAVLLCDSRFSKREYQNHLSSWIRARVKKFDNFGQVQKELCGFFKRHKDSVIIKPAHDVVSSSFHSAPEVPVPVSLTYNHTKIKDYNQPAEDILKGYCIEKPPSADTVVKRKQSVFDAMEMELPTTSNSADRLNAHCTKVTQNCAADLQNETVSKRRKINIQPVGLNAYSTKEEEDADSAIKARMAREEKRQYLKQILMQIHATHGSEGRKRLEVAVEVAKANGDIKPFVNVLLDICREVPNKRELFNNAILLLPTHMRQGLLNYTRSMILDS